MTPAPALLRSMLYIPASKPRALEKARGLPCDAIIFDLEDAVAPDEKATARDTLSAALGGGGYGTRLRLVRVNGAGTPWHEDDLAAASVMACDALLLPKVEDAAVLDEVAGRTERALWCMIETPRGVLNALAIADHPRVRGFVLGTNDLTKELGVATGDRRSIATAIQMSVMAARAAGIACIDGVFNAFRDDDGLKAECAEGRALGMDGKSLIHPAQIELANAAFAPTDDEIDLARRQIEAHEDALSKGEGVAVVDGRIVEALHIETARATLHKARAIAEQGA